MICERAAGPVREVAFRPAPGPRLAISTPKSGAKPRPKLVSAAIVSPTTPVTPDTEIHPTPEVLDALARAQAVIVGPSNPVMSIWPILHVLGTRC